MERSIIVTGASRGIGRSIALKAAEKGYQVCVNYKGAADKAEAVVREIEAAGGTAIAVQADMTKEADILRMFDTVDKELAPLGALVNNAGIVDKGSKVENMNLERLERMFATNITGPFLCAREAVKRLSTTHGGKGGVIVNISSVAAKTGAPNEYVDYAASKGAIDAMTLGLAKEVAAEGIRVNAVRPGIIYTDIHASGGEPDRVERFKSMVPMLRGGQPEEIADAVLWLLSERSSYVTGSLIDVSGGR
ncbi:MAG: NAD(P)-dependent oxidoreductase [Sneathiella sp.]|uniref:SDR family oxidoreductase n=1 Tax=Sneathiella sp. TaxID=1964365 RepID=UPI000C4AE326|nr:SDR family oxidoreductase [Sneathiella sp.]MAZ01603.1 NAD(P)-dependent oxidoreductase [Sneathiella sp.]